MKRFVEENPWREVHHEANEVFYGREPVARSAS